MTAQRLLTGVAVAAGLVAGVVYYIGAQRVPVVVAAADLATGKAITPTDLDLREMPPDALPAGALSDTADVVGRFPRGPIWRGQLILSDSVATAPAAFDGGVAPPTGYHAIGIPVEPALAVGGALVPGARVDVIAVPVAGKAPEDRETELLASAALVIDVRGDQGGPFERRAPPRQAATLVRERLGSIVIAVGPSQELAIADRIPTSTFVLVLVADRR